MGSRESHTIQSVGGVSLDARLYPAVADSDSEHRNDGLVAVLVHPYSVLGGFQGLMKGMASGLANSGVTALTFNMRGVGNSTGRASLTGFAEVEDVVSGCKWTSPPAAFSSSDLQLVLRSLALLSTKLRRLSAM